MYRILLNYCIAIETIVVDENFRLPGFLSCKQEGVIILRCIGMYPAVLQILLQVILHFLQLYFTHSLLPGVSARLCKI